MGTPSVKPAAAALAPRGDAALRPDLRERCRLVRRQPRRCACLDLHERLLPAGKLDEEVGSRAHTSRFDRDLSAENATTTRFKVHDRPFNTRDSLPYRTGPSPPPAALRSCVQLPGYLIDASPQVIEPVVQGRFLFSAHSVAINLGNKQIIE